uniref:Uncharacterized protein n=1 Tax=Grammatophora oceanica TaxID=210454 RepID=A0A7S1Y614_9STRA|mmetsp:Transcript_23692/g.35083  ORF Transcript_23692/g.35083 Transcript_23692/m.35083 type:complete len:151 (+) Transcript_23692:180-632(+)
MAQGEAEQLWQEAINCFLELKGLHRFRHDLPWGHLLRRFRDGVPTVEDILLINERVVQDPDSVPSDIRFGTYRNRTRDYLNSTKFDGHLHSSSSNAGATTARHLLILADNIKMKGESKTYDRVPDLSTFYEFVGESTKTAGNSVVVLTLS